MPLLQMPAPRAHEQHRGIAPERVLLLAGVERDRPLERVGQVPLPVDAVRPGRRVRVLEVGHEHPRARVERVDHHLPVDRPRDLDAPVGDLLGRRRHAPGARADLGRPGQEVWELAAVESLEPLLTPRQQLDPTRAERALQVVEEAAGLVGEDVSRVDHRVIIPFRLRGSRRARRRPDRRVLR